MLPPAPPPPQLTGDIGRHRGRDPNLSSLAPDIGSQDDAHGSRGGCALPQLSSSLPAVVELSRLKILSSPLVENSIFVRGFPIYNGTIWWFFFERGFPSCRAPSLLPPNPFVSSFTKWLLSSRHLPVRFPTSQTFPPQNHGACPVPAQRPIFAPRSGHPIKFQNGC